jgi:hypothetical protein
MNANAVEQRELTVGVLGGMGPQATVDFMAKAIALTNTSRDQDHLRPLVNQNPKVPTLSAGHSRALAGDHGDGDPGNCDERMQPHMWVCPVRNARGSSFTSKITPGVIPGLVAIGRSLLWRFPASRSRPGCMPLRRSLAASAPFSVRLNAPDSRLKTLTRRCRERTHDLWNRLTENRQTRRLEHLAFRENAFSIRVARKCHLNASRSRTFYLHAPSDRVASSCLSLGTRVTQARTSSWPVSQVVGCLSFVEACVVRRQSCHWRLRLCTQSRQHVSSTQ